MKTLKELTSTHAADGRLEWIGIRPARRGEVIAVANAELLTGGIEGDHHTSGGKRSVTIIQAEHLPVIASLASLDAVPAELLRRNLVVSGINLAGLKLREFRIGTAVLRGTGICAPCSRMEEALGPGGYSAVRGHGGITAEIVVPGRVCVGDAVCPA